MKLNALRRAIHTCGTQTQMATKLNAITNNSTHLTQPHIAKWVKLGHVPSQWVLDVEKVSGIPCWELRPDLYPPTRFSDAA